MKVHLRGAIIKLKTRSQVANVQEGILKNITRCKQHIKHPVLFVLAINER